MPLNPDTGLFQITQSLALRPGMTHDALLAQPAEWEEWLHDNDAPVAYRYVFDMPTTGKPEKTVLIVEFDGPKGVIAAWNISPWELMEGYQAKPEGRFTKTMREWFEFRHDTALPLVRPWGRVNAAYDPHNQTTMVLCNFSGRA